MRIGLYGNFGAGNLGNECTLQAVIEQIRQRAPDAQFLCFCTDPDDVRSRHGIDAFRAAALDHTAAAKSGGRLSRLPRILFYRIPLEIAHWIRSLRAVARTDVLMVAGTGIVQDYMCGPLAWPYEIFKLSLLAVLCRVRLVFLSVGAGPINHPLARWFLKRSLGFAQYRSYRDEASKAYLRGLGFDSDADPVYPDVVFGLSPGNFAHFRQTARERPVVGLGLKDFTTNSLGTESYRHYLETMANFVSWLQARGYDVRLLIGDFAYDTSVRAELVEILGRRGVPVTAPLLRVEAAPTVAELLRQLGEADMVLSPRYHNLVMSLIQGKPVMALSDHPKVDSLITDFGLGQYRVSLEHLSDAELMGRFSDLQKNLEELRRHVTAGVQKYRQALDQQYATLLLGDGRGVRPVSAAR
jgi:polysaccharide pyruvyl transferase WcaK-like protein